DQSGNSIELDVNLEALQESAMKNDKEYIGKVAFPVYLRWKTESEVAVIEYIRLNTTIPIPKVYYWNSSVNNPSGLSINKKEIFLLKIIEILLALKKLTFSKVGSIFFDKNNQFKIGQVIEIDLFSDEQATLSTMKKGPFNTTKEYILADDENKFVLTHRDFHSSNILVNNDEIMGSLIGNILVRFQWNAYVPTQCGLQTILWWNKQMKSSRKI
ncbi:2051_t:CDS:2, partial [Racocetra persica]